MLSKYKTIALDCDGVILNSNKIKTDAFYKTALPFGEEQAESLSRYHRDNGGVSRFKKFEWFVDSYVEKTQRKKVYARLLSRYQQIVEEELQSCEFNEDLLALKGLTANARWLVVSGGSQEELRSLFSNRKINGLFDGGIFGSPDTKEGIFEREIHHSNIVFPALYIGDSKYDYWSSAKYALDFVFLTQWTEVNDWEQFCIENKIRHIESLRELI